MAFLSVLTRHQPKREYYLTLNRASLRLQTDPDYEQLLAVDNVGRGWEHAQKMLAQLAGEAMGQYILALDDDDMLINAWAIEHLKQAAHANPPAVIWRAWHNDAGILPDNGHWGRKPELGFIGTCGFVVRTDVYREHIGPLVGHYASDFDLISAVYAQHGDNVVWMDELCTWAIRRSFGG